MTKTSTASRSIRISDATYTDPFPAGTRQTVYKPTTWLVSVEYDDGDRFVTVAPPAVLAAFRIGR